MVNSQEWTGFGQLPTVVLYGDERGTSVHITSPNTFQIQKNCNYLTHGILICRITHITGPISPLPPISNTLPKLHPFVFLSKVPTTNLLLAQIFLFFLRRFKSS